MKVLDYLQRTVGMARRKGEECEQREKREEEARQAVASLPGEAAVDKIVRYESALERQLGAGAGPAGTVYPGGAEDDVRGAAVQDD